jgi:hypothetical protein
VEDEGEASAVVSDGQGIQIGTGNVQNNTYTTKGPLASASLRALNIHAAVERLQRTSHDEVVDFFATARLDDVADLLAAFLETDVARLVAVLADINRRQAAELITPLVATAAWLAELPEAAEAIGRRGSALRWVRAGALEHFSEGYVRRYSDGRIFWSDGHGVKAVRGEIESYHETMSERLGFPTGDQETAPSSPFGTDGIRQSFKFRMVYSSKHGSYGVYKGGLCFEGEGGSAGWLGFPVGGLERNFAGSMVQRFEGGAIYYSRSEEVAFAVRSDVIKAIPRLLFLRRWMARPISNEVDATSSLGTLGSVQRFHLEKDGQEQESAAYLSDKGSVFVAPEFWNYYRGLGGEGSWLGFPVNKSEWWTARSNRLRPYKFQDFEAGRIYWRSGVDPIAVPNAVVEKISRDPMLSENLGCPVSEEQLTESIWYSRVQYFENGYVTRRNGRVKIRLRP